MKKMKTFFSFLCVLSLFKLRISIQLDVFKAKIESAKNKTDEILNSIYTKWQVKDYPNFLSSAAMTHTAWEVLKVFVIYIP